VDTVLIFRALENSGYNQLNEIVSSHKGLRFTELVIIIIIIIIITILFSLVRGFYSLAHLLKRR
jgi:hypothetical protein